MTDEPDPLTAAKSYVLRALSKRMLSEAELGTRLKRREHTQDTIQTVIEWAEELRLIDDEAVSEAIAREAQRTCRGPRWIQEKSRKRGVDASLENSKESDELLERAMTIPETKISGSRERRPSRSSTSLSTLAGSTSPPRISWLDCA